MKGGGLISLVRDSGEGKNADSFWGCGRNYYSFQGCNWWWRGGCGIMTTSRGVSRAVDPDPKSDAELLACPDPDPK